MKKKLFLFLLLISSYITPNLGTLQASVPVANQAVYKVPASPRSTSNFNPGRKLPFGDTTGVDQPGFDDSAWANVSLPHTWNDIDSYRAYISHAGGDQSIKLGIGWYRKHFK